MNLSSVDLNLLVVLGAVLEEGSATRAAARLHVTQSAVSNALRRLRALFDDPLVIRRPYGLVPTPRALALTPELRSFLDGAKRVLAGAPEFDPATTTRTFTIACSDAIGVTLLPGIFARLEQAMPQARLRLITIERMIATEGLERGEADLLVGIPPSLPSGCDSERVYTDPLSCIVRRGSRRIPEHLTLDAYTSLPHVEIALFGQFDEQVDRALARHGRTRVVKLAVAHFSSLPFAVLERDCVATLSGRIARRFAAHFPLRVVRPPIAMPKLTVSTVWHRRSEHDPGVVLLRRLIKRAAAMAQA